MLRGETSSSSFLVESPPEVENVRAETRMLGGILNLETGQFNSTKI